MKKILCSMLAVLFLSDIITGCTHSLQHTAGTTQNAASSGSLDIVSVLFHQPYIDASGISVHYASERKKMPTQIESLLSENPVHLRYEKGGVFGADFFSVTSAADSYYYYYGAVKDNRPDGVGVLTSGIVDLNDPSKIGHLIYAGNFKKGAYNGYGALFETTDADSISYISKLVDAGGIEDKYRSILTLYLTRHVAYDGDFKNGVKNGEGNFFRYSDIMLSNSKPQENYWANSVYPTIAVTEVKKDEINGNIKYYESGALIYDGESKKGYRDGKGVFYYPNGQKQYDGEWKRDEYYGEGTLYDENGNVIYEGKWESGDYAS